MKQMFVFLTYYVKTLNSVATGNKNTFSTGEHYLLFANFLVPAGRKK